MATIYKKQCTDWGNTIKSQADAFYDHQIKETDELINNVTSNGQDPKKFPLEGGIVNIDYEELLSRTKQAKQSAYDEADVRIKSCENGALPDWLGDTQKIFDYAMTIALLPYLIVMKDFSSMKIDLGEVYKGRTFGGDNALIPKAREDVLVALGISGDVASFARDPINTVQNAVASAIEKAKDLLPNIDLPTIDLPKVDLPNIDLPKIDLPKIDPPKIDLPEIDPPKIDLPVIKF
jgi:hypothetical protein